MTYKKGQSGNPAGKPKGTRNKSTVLLEALLDDKAEALAKKAMEMAEAGDPAMMRLCLERLIAPRKDRPIKFELPELKNADDAAKCILGIMMATSRGEITPSEAAELSKVIENYAGTARLADLEARLAELEPK